MFRCKKLIQIVEQMFNCSGSYDESISWINYVSKARYSFKVIRAVLILFAVIKSKEYRIFVNAVLKFIKFFGFINVFIFGN